MAITCPLRFACQCFHFMLQFEDAAKEIADEITKPRPEGDDEVQDIQIMLTSKENPCNIRALKVCKIRVY